VVYGTAPHSHFCYALRLLDAVLLPKSLRTYRRLVVVLVLLIVLVAFVRVPFPQLPELPVSPLHHIADGFQHVVP
jgi:hypothetical protein